MKVRAHAKLNLALAVAPPEPDGARVGWHRIASWMHAIDLHDEIEIEPLDAAPSRYEIVRGDSPGAPEIDWSPDQDLAARAHRALEADAGRPLPVCIRITKHIPTGAGLGGGSSDAGAALSALNELFGLGRSVEKLQRIGASLGSDVPFFIDEPPPPRPALVRGFGDEIERLAPSESGVVLIIPAFGCATPGVYKAFDACVPGSAFDDRAGAVGAMSSGVLSDASLFNDLETPACLAEPRLSELLVDLRESSNRSVHLTGSGSACFVLCREDNTGVVHREITDAVSKQGRNVEVIETRLV